MHGKDFRFSFGCGLVVVALALAGCPQSSTTPPSAAFTAQPVTGTAPLAVQFTDTSTPGSSAISTCVWQFGDGSTSTERNPCHRYVEEGVYTVCLEVTTADGSDAETKTNHITVNAPQENPLEPGDAADWTAPSAAVHQADAATAGSVTSQTAVHVDFGELGDEFRLLAELSNENAAYARVNARLGDATFVAVYRFLGGLCVINRLTTKESDTYLTIAMGSAPGSYLTPLGGFTLQYRTSQPRFAARTIGPVTEQFIALLADPMPAAINNIEDIPILVLDRSTRKAAAYPPNTVALKVDKLDLDDVFDVGSEFVGDAFDVGRWLLDTLGGMADDAIDAIELLREVPKTVTLAAETLEHATNVRADLEDAVEGLEDFVDEHAGDTLPEPISMNAVVTRYENVLTGATGGSGIADMAGLVTDGFVAAAPIGPASGDLEELAATAWGNASDVSGHIISAIDNVTKDSEVYFYLVSNGEGGLHVGYESEWFEMGTSLFDSIIAAIEAGMDAIEGLDTSAVIDALESLQPEGNYTVRGGVDFQDRVLTLFHDISEMGAKSHSKIWDVQFIVSDTTAVQVLVAFEHENGSVTAELNGPAPVPQNLLPSLHVQAVVPIYGRQVTVDINVCSPLTPYGFLVLQADIPLEAGSIEVGVAFTISAPVTVLTELDLTDEEFLDAIQDAMALAADKILLEEPGVQPVGDGLSLLIEAEDFFPALETILTHLGDEFYDVADELRIEIQFVLEGGLGPDIELVSATVNAAAAFSLSMSLQDCVDLFAGAVEAAEFDPSAALEILASYDAWFQEPGAVHSAAILRAAAFARELLTALYANRDALAADSFATLADSGQIGYSVGISASASANAGAGVDGQIGVNGGVAINLEAALFAAQAQWCLAAQLQGVPDICAFLSGLDTGAVPTLYLGANVYGQFAIEGPVSIVQIGAGIGLPAFACSIEFGDLDIATSTTAELCGDTTHVEPGESVTFQYGACPAEGAVIQRFCWDLDGDGNIDLTTYPADGGVLEVDFPNAGQFVVSMTAVASDGSRGVARWTVFVGEGAINVSPGEMIVVPAGAFDMGDPWDEGWNQEQPVHTVSLSQYEIGKHEVTNQEYADALNWAWENGQLDVVNSFGGLARVAAGGQTLLSGGCYIDVSDGLFVTEMRDSVSMANHPMTYVTWYGAAAYCNWVSQANGLDPCYDMGDWSCHLSKNGYHLPTEAQWERAAAWDAATSRHWRYCFSSDALDPTRCNYDLHNPLGWTSQPFTVPVGYFNGVNPGTVDSHSPVGCYEMSGNVREWCNDWFDPDYYESSPAVDPLGPDTGGYRVLRGSDWERTPFTCRSTFRHIANHTPTYKDDVTGFRIAR